MQEPFRLVRQALGPLPLLDRVMERIRLLDHLSEATRHVPYAEALLLLLKNILLERHALYAIREWSAQYDPALVYGGKYGDDMLARALDRLFEADRASLLTRVVLTSVKAYQVDLSQIHQDTTSVKLCGAYSGQQRGAVQLRRGYSKDHRPDLLQLVYELSVTHDGAIPLLFKAHDGNRTDDTLHWENWLLLRGILGRSDFLYVADSKLCVSKVLLDIDRNQGRFVTVLPRTRGEAKEFQAQIEASLVRWEKVWAKRSSRKRRGIDLYEVATGVYQMQEGFRLYWFRSSEKARRDRQEREDKIASALDHLRALTDPARKKKPRTEKALRRKVDEILAHFAVEPWLHVEIVLDTVEQFRQINRGRSSVSTLYRKIVRHVPRLIYARDEQAISKSELMDGIFPLATNTERDAFAVLRAYKYQPQLEKRHALLKSILQVAPIFLKKNERIEALMFVYFLAQLVSALLERQLRNAMREHGLSRIQILPEDRPSATPTIEQVVRVFRPCARHLLFSQKGKLVQTFSDPLSPIQQQILSLLAVSPAAYR
jgi:transposase